MYILGKHFPLIFYISLYLYFSCIFHEKAWLAFFTFILEVRYFVQLLKSRNPHNFPPGPWGLPFLGNISVGLDQHAIEKLSVKYGDIFSLRVATQKIVVVSGYKLVEEVLLTQGHNFLDRPVSPLFKVYQGNGICKSSGYRWRRQRQFFDSQLKKSGEAKRKQELIIQQECVFLCEAIQKNKGCPFNPHPIINSAVANVIASLVFGKRFDYEDTDFLNLLNLSAESSLLAGSPLVQVYGEFPSLMKRFQGPHTKIWANYATMVGFLKKQIEMHKKDWDPFVHRDFSDVYIGEIDKRRRDTDAAFSVDNLAHCVLDLIEAGTGPMTSTLCWGLLLMAKHPEVQKGVQAEIDCVIGQSRRPCLLDRASMPYTEAVLHEIQRVGNILPLGIPHSAGRDTTVCNYFIPKGTVVVTNLASVLNDKTQWERPQQFYPEHFLDDQGKFRNREAFLPYSAGKRACLGENLARMEIFLFFTSVLQRFTISAPQGVKLSMEAHGASLLSPKPFHICVSSR
ncbi:cytochrome P450 2J1-like [Astyanax mexicanus]|uniref:Cytochrome P450 2J1-like n=1 Tax=Astyanax mexicanus TaxID=7994 RepID=A0A8B9J6B8_ASTMX|nr:cytochrome P450 2J1-like [Astyanax mexicanus]